MSKKNKLVIYITLILLIYLMQMLIFNKGKISSDEMAILRSVPINKTMSGSLRNTKDEKRREWQNKPWLAHLAPEYQEMEAANWWKAPIFFYGKVIDENKRPMSDSVIEIVVSDISTEGTTIYRYKSDENGLFTFAGKRGRGISVKVTKRGYYETAQSTRHFNYGGEGKKAFRPDPNSPVDFYLHKKGRSEPLISVERQIYLKPGSNPQSFDLFQLIGNRAGWPEAFTIQQITLNKKDEKGNTFWSYVLSVEGGGIVEKSEEFEWWAPEGGYVSRLKLEIAENVEKEYFLKFSNGNYGRIWVRFIPGADYIRVRSHLNPDGSRNLEWDNTKYIRPIFQNGNIKLIYPQTSASSGAAGEN